MADFMNPHGILSSHDRPRRQLPSVTTTTTSTATPTINTIVQLSSDFSEQLSSPSLPSIPPPSTASEMPSQLPTSRDGSPTRLRVPKAKRSYQQLPHLSIPSEPKPFLSPPQAKRFLHAKGSNEVQPAEEPTSAKQASPETPSSTSTPETPISLSSPTVGVVDLTQNVKTTSSVPVSHGGYSDIYRGELELRKPDSEGDGKIDKIQVAVKVLRVLSSKGYDEAKARKRLNREVYVWHRLDHPNIATFFGTSYHMADRPSLILPWFSNGSASEYLRLRNPKADRLKLILDIAEGLEYLHTYRPAPIVHGDLKGNNILITDERRAILSDFGLSQVIEDLMGPTGITPSCTEGGPVRWQSPECVMDFSETYRPQLPGDVWSFGCTAYELLTNQVPYHFRRRDSTVIHDIEAGVLPPGEEENDQHRGDGGIWDLMNDCWIYEPTQRIQMTEVVRRLKALCSSTEDTFHLATTNIS